MMSPFTHARIGGRVVGTGNPIFLMADIGLTHDGDIGKALELAELASEQGADAIKIQVVDYDMLMPDRSAAYTYETAEGPKEETLYEIFRSIWLEPDEIAQLADKARNLGMELIATADYESAVDILEDVGVNCHKIDTWSVRHRSLIERIGNTGKPMMLDMGMSTQHGLAAMLDWFHMAGGKEALILHDFRSNDPLDMRFRNIPHLQQTFGFPVGFTPQGRDAKLDHLAVGVGVDFLEKRLTLDTKTPRNGHFKALDGDEWAEWAQEIRFLETAMGGPAPIPPHKDIAASKRFLKSLYLAKDVAAGERVTPEHFHARRPGTGRQPDEIPLLAGKKATKNLKAGTMLADGDLE